MRIVVLGSAAGGGLPQWNCACAQCDGARHTKDVEPRTQDSLAVSADGVRWVLLNASPDVRQQIERTRALWPRADRQGRGQTPIAAVVVTNGDLDHCLGLFALREWSPLNFYATGQTYAGLVEHNAMMRTLDRKRPHLQHRKLQLNERTAMADPAGKSLGLSVTAFAAKGKVPLHLESLQPAGPEVNVGLLLEEDDGLTRLLYVPGAGNLDGTLERTRSVDCLFFDGTFWSNDELCRHERAARSAIDMAHCPVGGPMGSLRALSELSVKYRFYTHINNTNPMLKRGSPEAIEVERAGLRLATDAQELLLL